MRRPTIGLVGLLWLGTAHGQVPSPSLPAPRAVEARYATYAAGLEVADVDADFSIGRWMYQMNLAYHTTGMVGFFYRGHQFSSVSGSWHGDRPDPSHYFADGVWRGIHRVTDIEYAGDRPSIRQMIPPVEQEREPVPDALQNDSIDTLSALMNLLHAVAGTGRCDLDVRTYDGRRATEIHSQTVGMEELKPTSRSSFSGKTLRCDFAGRMLAGFVLGDDKSRNSQPLHGSAWLAQVMPGAPPIPVRMSFETRWFGDATMYLTSVAPATDVQVARTP